MTPMATRRTAILIAALLPISLYAQAAAEYRPVESLPMRSSQIPGPYSGSVSDLAAQATTVLTIRSTVELALRNNLAILVGTQVSEEARGYALSTLSALLPQSFLQVNETVQRINLAQYGFRANDPLVGPYSVFESRVSVAQPILDRRALLSYRASRERVRTSQLDLATARELVTAAAAAAYLQAATALANIESEKKQLATARILYDQARELRAAGASPAIDVLRAQVSLRAREQNLLDATNQYGQALLTIARITGLPNEQPVRLSAPLVFRETPVPDQERAREQAFAHRPEYQVAQSELRTAQLDREAAKAGYLPTVGVSGNYGVVGAAPASAAQTYAASIAFTVPVFQGRRVEGETTAATAKVRQRQAELENIRARIDEEIRRVRLDLKTLAERSRVAQDRLAVADDTLAQAVERFKEGVTTNLEVVQAQADVAAANQDVISTVYLYFEKRVEFGRAIGNTLSAIAVLQP